MKLFSLLLVAHTLAFGQSMDLPPLGEKFRIEMRDGYLTAFGRSSRSPYVNKSYNGVQFQFAVDPDENLIYIGTQDFSFRTPEGLKIGASFNEVSSAGGSPLVNEEGFPPYSILPSGWCALFPERHSNCFGPTLPTPEGELKVIGYFKRQSRPA